MTDDFEDESVKIRQPLFHETVGEGKERTIVEVDLVIRSNGDLVIDGWDYGAAPREIFGDSDYEYWLTIRSQDKDRVFEELLADAGGAKHASSGDKDIVLLDLLVERFGTSCTPHSEMKKWLQARGIPFSFDSYT